MLDMYKGGSKHPNAAPWFRFVIEDTTYRYVDMYEKRSRTTSTWLLGGTTQYRYIGIQRSRNSTSRNV